IPAINRTCQFDEPPDICLEGTAKGPLPELRDDLDEFFREVEYSPICELTDQSKDLNMDGNHNVLIKDISSSNVSPVASISSMLSTPFDNPLEPTSNSVKLFSNDYTCTLPVCGMYEDVVDDRKMSSDGYCAKNHCYQNSDSDYQTFKTADSNVLSYRRSRKRLADCTFYDLCLQPTQ
uniref:SERTA domain-containing protein n=1 Tax=Syphacia muris TaxID=451379 RepID=A0A0N5AC78_9BILA